MRAAVNEGETPLAAAQRTAGARKQAGRRQAYLQVKAAVVVHARRRSTNVEEGCRLEEAAGRACCVACEALPLKQDARLARQRPVSEDEILALDSLRLSQFALASKTPLDRRGKHAQCLDLMQQQHATQMMQRS